MGTGKAGRQPTWGAVDDLDEVLDHLACHDCSSSLHFRTGSCTARRPVAVMAPLSTND